MPAATAPARPLSNAQIARQLVEIADNLKTQGENQFKVRAYRRAAETVAGLSENVDQFLRAGGDITRFPGIGKSIAAALREIVQQGPGGQLELPMATSPATPAAAPRILLSDADVLAAKLVRYLQKPGGAARAEVIGQVRRRVEVVDELGVLVEAPDWDKLVTRLEKFERGIDRVDRTELAVGFRLPGSIKLTVQRATPQRWGLNLIVGTGSLAHLQKLEEVSGALVKFAQGGQACEDELAVYRALGLQWIPPELREGGNEVTLAARSALPKLVKVADILGELHAHTTASDGSHPIEEMAAAAAKLGHTYLGITDHSQSLKIAGGVPAAKLWQQIKRIDALNAKGLGVRLLKSAEVDILTDGSLDYPDGLLAELDYTVCSIHSRFRLNQTEQTERILRAMDDPAFTILGHATGRRLLRRPGYEIDFPRVVQHAKDRGCFFEINASPERLDLSAEHARVANEAGIKIAICTDAHDIGDLKNLAYGVDVARRAGLQKSDVLNSLSWPELKRTFRRSPG